MNKETIKAGLDLTIMFSNFSEQLGDLMDDSSKKDVDPRELLVLLTSHMCSLLLVKVFPNYLDVINEFGDDIKKTLIRLDITMKEQIKKTKKGT